MDVEIVVAGTSLGGLRALETLLAGIPDDFRVPLAIVQHRRADSDNVLARLLRRATSLRVCEPQDKEPIVPGHIYIAPPDYHLLVEPGAFALSTDAPVCSARPSIDVLFESAADAYGSRVIGVVMTGANSDGARGAARIHAVGGMVIVQDPADAECPVMPKAVLQIVDPDYVLPLCQIGATLARLCNGPLSPRDETMNTGSHLRIVR